MHDGRGVGGGRERERRGVEKEWSDVQREREREGWTEVMMVQEAFACLVDMMKQKKGSEWGRRWVEFTPVFKMLP